MAAKSRTNVYLDSNTKQEAIKILKEYGIGLSDAINIFLKQVVIEKGIPFKPVNPNIQLDENLIIEPVAKDDLDYKLIKEAEKGKSYSLEEAKKLIKVN